MNLIVLDNFLPYPNVVRSWAMQQKYYTGTELTDSTGQPNTWPGKRTTTVNDLDLDYANAVLSRVAYIAQTHFGLGADLSIRSSFQLTLEEDGESWIHTDHTVSVAGLLFLTPNAPLEAGTLMYSAPPHEVVDTIGNVYNRLIMYRANIYHKSAQYFGNSLETGRLTQVIFIEENS